MQITNNQLLIGYLMRLAAVVTAAALVAACSDDGEPTRPGEPVPVASVVVTPLAQDVPLGQTLQLTAVALAANGDTLEDRQITWSSNNTDVASVSATGLLTAKAGGIALIQATTSSKTGSANITVVNPTPAVTAIQPATVQAGSPAFQLTVTGASFVAGSTVYFNGAARPTQYISATELRAQISAPDVELAGNAAIRVTSPLPGGGVSGDMQLTVTAMAEVALVQITPGATTLWLGETMHLSATAFDAQGRPVINAPIVWNSNNSAVATASATGIVMAVGAGSTAIEARVGNVTGYAGVNVWTMQSTYDIVYEDYDGSQPTLFVVSPGVLTAPRRLLPAGTFAIQPAVTNDGNRVAFVGWNPTTGNRDIFTVNRDGSDLRRITTNDAIEEAPAWSPDGTRIAFHSLRNGYRDIFVINEDGTNEVNLTATPIRVGVPLHAQPTWSADGNTIVFTLRDMSIQSSPTRLMAMNADGSNVRPLTQLDGYSSVEPSFSRDGSMIVFRKSHPLYGNQIAAIRQNGEPLYWLPNPGHGHSPRLSANAQWLAFASSDDFSQPADIYVWHVGSQARKRVTFTGSASNPAWMRR